MSPSTQAILPVGAREKPVLWVFQTVSSWNVFVVPTIVSSLVAAQQENRGSPRVKRVKHAVRLAIVLDSQLAHVAVVHVCAIFLLMI
jgi:hypothetical protein